MLSILALDLDETLVRSDQTISPHTLDQLARWDAAGHRIVIATGRPPRRTRAIPDALHRYPWVCYNGSVVLDQGRLIHQTTIPAADAAALVETYMGLLPHAWVEIEANDHAHTNRFDTAYDAIYTQDIRKVARRATAKIYLLLDDYRQVADQLPVAPSMRVLISNKYNIAQIMPTGVSKAAGLRVLTDGWGQSLRNVIAFGDDTNDLEMIRDAGLGVAMGNAVPELKAVANRVTLTNDEEGVAVVVAEYLDA
jgi:hypothetical protein